ncbi:carbohydrate-binding module family 13 protein [Serendipita vermifera MAFF 305830]|uniref:Carbohydrate-binding module family 13 protein n=1 Tax=Serendipita vermifera MAFF 305830 TaxID=933852 RepID=A0A0C3BPU9_SERVB|nr:carbohydrate-binding module family 13 protein [Serendipita vermifera MAFF 305830]
MKFTAAFVSLAAALVVSADPILQAPVNTPTLIQTFIVNPRFAPCLQAQGNYNGAPVIIGDCGDWHGANEEWTVVQGGGVEGSGDPGPVTQIRIFGDKCLDVPNGSDYNGNKLQIWTCYDGNANQLWQVGDNGIRWASHNKCLDLTDGNLNSGTRTQIWTCGTPESPSINQSWNAVPPR